MPQGDGTGPLGRGPMTGRGEGFCVLRMKADGSSPVKGFAGLQGKPVYAKTNNRKEAVMPAGDGTGPMGMGPMTGRAAGYCAGYGMPGYTNPIAGRGLGMGFGRGRGFWGGGRGGGRGWRNRVYAAGVPGSAWGGMPYGAPYAVPYASAPTKEQELDMLKGQAGQFEAALGDIRKRLQELETEKETQ
jgi:hypothetical protein